MNAYRKPVDDYSEEEWEQHVNSIAPDVLRVVERKSFFDVLDERVFPTRDPESSTCEHTFAKTLALLEEQGFNDDDRDDIMNVFQSRGGFCDCEVLFNAAPDSDDLPKERYWKEKARQAKESA